MLLLVILLHLAIAAPLHEIYDQAVIADKIKKSQNQNEQVAVLPAGLIDQFQFAGKLNKPLIAQHKLSELAEWSVKNPQGFCMIFTKNKLYARLKGDAGTAKKYGDGWLIFRPSKDFISTYHQWTN